MAASVHRRRARLGSASGDATALTLVGIAALHVAWGRGSSFPFATRAELADAVVGTTEVPAPWACNMVAAGLGLAACLVAGPPIVPSPLRRTGVAAVAGVLAVRGVAGLAGRTDALAPGSTSPRFRRLDRRLYSPLCLALAAGAAWRSYRDFDSAKGATLLVRSR